MNIREELLKAHSREQADRICDYIGTDEKRFAELMEIMLGSEYRTIQRAAWPLSVCADKHPELFTPHLNKLLDLLLRDDLHNAVRRNITRLLQYVEIPKRLQGKAYSICLDLIADPKEFVAVKANAITVATQIARNEPTLMDELRMVSRPLLKDTPPSLKARLRPLFGKSLKESK